VRLTANGRKKVLVYSRARLAIFSSAFLAMGSLRADAASTTWGNSGIDWLTPSNWNAGVPDAATDAVFPSSLGATSPTLASNGSALGLFIDNGGVAYSMNGAGTLALEGLSVTGGGTTTIAPSLVFTSAGSFDVGAATQVSLNGALSAGALTLTKSGAGTLVLGANAISTNLMSMIINGGEVKVLRSSSLGSSPQITVNDGGTLHIDVPTAPSGDVNFGDAGASLILNNGATLRGGGQSPTRITSLTTSTMSPAIQNGASVTIDVPENDDQLVIANAIRNTSDAPEGTSSVIRVTGNGVLQLDFPSTASPAYTGSWNIDHTIIGNEAGATVINDVNALGARAGGAPASVTLTSGFLIDVRSSNAARVPNPMTFNGGFLNTSATLVGLSRFGAFFSGTMTIASTPGGSGLDMEDLFASAKNLNTTLSGQINGSGQLYIFGAIGAPTVGVLSLTNTSLMNSNTASGTFSVTNFTALDASSNNAGSDPLGTATVSLSGGTLRLNHPGSGSNGVISAYAANNVEVYAMDTAFGDQNGTITVGSAGANTGNTIVLGALTFNSTGATSNQTLTTNNAFTAINYKLRFSGVTTLAGNATFTAGANPASVELAGKVTGAGNLIKAGNNTLTLSGAASDYTGSTSVNAGTLVFNATHAIAQLNVANNARAVVSSGGDKVLSMTGLSILGTGRLDLTDEDAVVDYSASSPLANIQSLLASGFSGGTWTGPGITSSAAAAAAGTSVTTALGFAEASNLFNTFPSSFSGVQVDSTSILIRYTAYGDANLDGAVDTTDFNILAANFSGTGLSWAQGDFNYDGNVDTTDFNLLASDFGALVPAAGLAAGGLVPEPSTGALLLLTAGVAARRRKI
jgi:autotransporter-associated beta strand protein